MHFILKRSKNNEFFFTLHARNGQVVLTSETYKRRAGAMKTLNRINERFTIPLPIQTATGK